MQLRLCLVAVKLFSENTYFLEMLIFGKGKCFHVFGCISKNFPEKIFWCLEKKEEYTNQKTQGTTQKKKKNHQFQKCFQFDDRDHSAIAIRDCDRDLAFFARSRSTARSRSCRRSRRRTGAGARDLGLDLLLSRARARALSLSLIFWKCFEGKIEV